MSAEHRVTRRARRSRVRTPLVAGVVLLLVVAGVALALQRSWSVAADRAGQLDAERRGLTLLRPTVNLLGALSAAQSTAASGTEVSPTALRAGLSDLTAGQSRADLGYARQSVDDLRATVQQLIDRPPTGAQAYSRFDQAIIQATNLISEVGERSRLVHEPNPDAAGLVDAGLRQLPETMVATGRAAAISALAGDRPDANETLRLAVARHQAARAGEAANTGLRRTIEIAGRESTGSVLLGPLAAFQNAVDDVAPATLVWLTQDSPALAPLPPGADKVQSSASALATATLEELDRVLADERAAETGRQRDTVLIAAGILLGAGLLLFLRLPARRPEVDEADLPETDQTDGQEAEPVELIDARDLLRNEELVHVGRGVRRVKRTADDAE
jgi:hypothetical protein